MDEQFSPISIDKFKLWEKWFWIGIVVAVFNVVGGLIYGIALLTEKKHRKEGLTIIIFSIIWGAVKLLVIVPWYLQSDIFLKLQPAIF